MQIYFKHVDFARRFEGSSPHLPLFAITYEGRVEGYNNSNNTWSGGQRGGKSVIPALQCGHSGMGEKDTHKTSVVGTDLNVQS